MEVGNSRKADSGDAVAYFNIGDFVTPIDGSRRLTRGQSEQAEEMLQNTIMNVLDNLQDMVGRRFSRDYKDDLKEIGLKMM